ncbi:MAG: ImmA/IrrE family metallo-endopeptidase [Rhodospirillales bacterium]|nr:ImmA/IrrE family metallo-endopeptidase [Rhodospirillales bacterium]
MGDGRKSPKKTANDITALLTAVLGEERFPVNVELVAKEYSEKTCADPITRIVGASLDDFDGMLRPSNTKPCWHIIYNTGTAYPGRERFTLAHELGHYLLHREPLKADDYRVPMEDEAVDARSFSCTPLERHTWKTSYEQMEEEADTFASYLLMPMNDYRNLIDGEKISFELLRAITSRYDVSLTAAARKWLEFTNKRAAMVVARDGFALWGRASTAALKSGIFICSGMPIPDQSIATLGPDAQGCEKKLPIQLPPGVWSFRRGSESVQELTIFSERLARSLSLLIFEDTPDRNPLEEQEEWDTYDQCLRHG